MKQPFLSDQDIYTGNAGKVFKKIYSNHPFTKVFLITDTNTHRDCLPVFLASGDLPMDLPGIVIPAGERFKTLETCEKIWRAMFDAGLDRMSLVINLGGGVIGDMGGFCAATYKRGIDFIQVPSTLLAMTDAAIGGKLAIDFQGFKNAVGVFKKPAAVIIDPLFLRTLPERELRSGFAEVIKHALIGDPELWAQIQKTDTLDGLDWDMVLQRSIQVKTDIVAQDPFEKNIRALLNFGHTVGHALESYYLDSDTPLTHGEAVYLGMICESILAGRTPQLWAGWGPLPHIPAAIDADLWEFMQQDKKNTSGKVRYAVPDVKPNQMKMYQLEAEDFKKGMDAFRKLVSAL